MSDNSFNNIMSNSTNSIMNGSNSSTPSVSAKSSGSSSNSTEHIHAALDGASQVMNVAEKAVDFITPDAGSTSGAYDSLYGAGANYSTGEIAKASTGGTAALNAGSRTANVTAGAVKFAANVVYQYAVKNDETARGMTIVADVEMTAAQLGLRAGKEMMYRTVKADLTNTLRAQGNIINCDADLDKCVRQANSNLKTSGLVKGNGKGLTGFQQANGIRVSGMRNYRMLTPKLRSDIYTAAQGNVLKSLTPKKGTLAGIKALKNTFRRYANQDDTIRGLSLMNSMRKAGMTMLKTSAKITKNLLRAGKVVAKKMILMTSLGRNAASKASAAWANSTVGKASGKVGKFVNNNTVNGRFRPIKSATQRLKKRFTNRIKGFAKKAMKKVLNKLFGKMWARFMSTKVGAMAAKIGTKIASLAAKLTHVVSTVVTVIGSIISAIISVCGGVVLAAVLAVALASLITGAITALFSADHEDAAIQACLKRVEKDYTQMLKDIVGCDFGDENVSINLEGISKRNESVYNDIYEGMEKHNADPVKNETTNSAELLAMTKVYFDYNLDNVKIKEAKEYIHLMFNGTHKVQASFDNDTSSYTLVTYYFDDIFKCKRSSVSPAGDLTAYASSDDESILAAIISGETGGEMEVLKDGTKCKAQLYIQASTVINRLKNPPCSKHTCDNHQKYNSIKELANAYVDPILKLNRTYSEYLSKGGTSIDSEKEYKHYQKVLKLYLQGKAANGPVRPEAKKVAHYVMTHGSEFPDGTDIPDSVIFAAQGSQGIPYVTYPNGQVYDQCKYCGKTKYKHTIKYAK